MEKTRPAKVPEGEQTASATSHLDDIRPEHRKSIEDQNLQPQKQQPHPTPQPQLQPPKGPLADNCDRRRPGEEDHSRLGNVPAKVAGDAVAPFLREHIPTMYAPIGKPETQPSSTKGKKDQNSRYCYRHDPDIKCRRAADEKKMAKIQTELDKLPSNHQQAVSQIWSVFSASPAKIREVILEGIITQCCFPQLSTVARAVQDQLKIDFVTALPPEISLRILCYLDSVSLCKAAQVSHKWRVLADDDLVWHNLCKQHIHRKCTSCGWGLPLLEAKRVRQWSRPGLPGVNLQQAIDTAATAQSSQPSSAKRLLTDSEEERPSKKLCAAGPVLPWKEVYRDRFKVGSNWKYGRCSMKIFRGHSNGVTCLQFWDNILATGSYDSTIKIWDIETGQEIRTLVGHTSGIRALQFDEKKLISGSLDHTIKIWDWQTGECVNTMTCHNDGVISVHFDGKWLASGSIDKSVKLFNFETRHTFSLRGHQDWVNHVRMDLHSRTVFSASDDCTVKLWDMDTKQCLETYVGHLGQVQQLLLMPDDFEPEEEGPHGESTDAVSESSGRGSTPATMATPAYTQAQDYLRSSTPMSDERTAFGPVFEDPSRPLPPRYMLTAGLDNTIRLWEVSTGRCIRTMFGHLEGIWGVAGDTLRVVTGAHDSSVKVWEPRSGKCQRTFTGHIGPVTCVGLSDSRLASGSEDGEVRLYTFLGNPSSLEECGTPA